MNVWMIVILLIRYWLIAGLTSWSFLTVWLLLWRRVKVILEIPICIPINKCKITYNGCFKTMTNKGNLRWSWTTEKLSNHGCRLLAMNKQVYCIQYLKKSQIYLSIQTWGIPNMEGCVSHSNISDWRDVPSSDARKSLYFAQSVINNWPSNKQTINQPLFLGLDFSTNLILINHLGH